MRKTTPWLLVLLLGVGTLPRLAARADAPEGAAATRVEVPKALLRHDDGDSFSIAWPGGTEVVRVLGVDTPETAHPEHDIPYPQPFGEAAGGFFRGCVAMAAKVEIARAAERDPYGRTLAYLFLDGRNYSALVIEARLAVETVGHFGDNGFPEQAAEVLAAARAAGPVPFEPPYRFRARMREVSAWLRGRGEYPARKDGDGSDSSPRVEAK